MSSIVPRKTVLSLMIAQAIDEDVSSFNEDIVHDFLDRASAEIMKMLDFMGVNTAVGEG